MYKQTDAGVVDEVEGLLGGRVGGHDNGWLSRVRGRWEICIVHEGDMRPERVTGGEMELESVRITAGAQQKAKGMFSIFEDAG